MAAKMLLIGQSKRIALVLTSSLMSGEYQRSVKDYSNYRAQIRGEGPTSSSIPTQTREEEEK